MTRREFTQNIKLAAWDAAWDAARDAAWDAQKAKFIEMVSV